MKRSLAVMVAVAAGSAMLVPASAAQARDLYMVRDVGYTNGVYYGDFAALSKTGKNVVGAIGAFSSEYTCIRAVIRNGKLRGTYYADGVPAGNFTRKWVGKRIKGTTRATYDDMVTYLDGGDPRALIANCRDIT
jgi:hypothetical protein